MRTHAIVWTSGEERWAGRLELFADRFELVGRDRRLTVPVADVANLSIERDRGARLLGMPVLVLNLRSGSPVRIAAFEGPGLLHSFAERIEQGRPAYGVDAGT